MIENKCIISIDPSVKGTGIFTIVNAIEVSKTIKNENVDFPSSLINIHYGMEFILQENRFDLCLIEEPYPMLNRGQDQLLRIAGVIECSIARYLIPVVRVPVQTWKSITGMNEINKKKDPEKYKKLAKEKYGKEFETLDELDAYLIYVCSQLLLQKTDLTKAARKVRDQIIDVMERPSQCLTCVYKPACYHVLDEICQVYKKEVQK